MGACGSATEGAAGAAVGAAGLGRDWQAAGNRAILCESAPLGGKHGAACHPSCPEQLPAGSKMCFELI